MSDKNYGFTTEAQRAQRSAKWNAGIMEYWNTGENQRSKDETLKSRPGFIFGFSIIPSFHYSVIPTDYDLRGSVVNIICPFQRGEMLR
jgi:hypothetical protein